MVDLAEDDMTTTWDDILADFCDAGGHALVGRKREGGEKIFEMEVVYDYVSKAVNQAFPRAGGVSQRVRVRRAVFE